MNAMEYVELSGVPESRWPIFREWFSWYAERGMVGVAKDGEEIVGVAVARVREGAFREGWGVSGGRRRYDEGTRVEGTRISTWGEEFSL